MTKKEILEYLHRNKWWVFVLVTILFITPSILGKSLIGFAVGFVFSIALLCWMIFSAKFETTHNYALLAVGDTQLDITFVPGDFIIKLPGFRTVQRHDGILLSTKEQSFKKENVSFEYGGTGTRSKGGTDDSNTDSVNADVEMNYYFDRFNLYRLIVRAPKDFENTLLTNACGDLSSAFQNRIADLDEAQAFKDIKFKNGKFFWDNDMKTISKLYSHLEALYTEAMAEQNSGTNVTTKRTAFNRELWETKNIRELDTTVERASKFGIHFNNITISKYTDSPENQALRSEAQQETLKNKRKLATQKGNQEVLEDYCSLYESKGYTPADALDRAEKQLSRDNKGLQDFNVSGNGAAGVILNASGATI